MPVRVLAVLQYPGHLRYFDSVLLELARRGHSVKLAFDQPEKQPEGLEALAGRSDNLELIGALPQRHDFWGPFARAHRGILDYLRYLHPEFSELSYLRKRWEQFVPLLARGLLRVPHIPPAAFRVGTRALRRVEEAVPSDPAFERYLTQIAPDVVLVSPYITTFFQSDLVKSARRLGIPTVYGVASWDNLTTKGQIRVVPDAITVWNETQRDEARDWHLVDPDIVEVTGAQNFDRWFATDPSSSREEFCNKVGLPADRPYVLFVGSTASISAPEAERGFVHRWVEAIRASADPRLRELACRGRRRPGCCAYLAPLGRQPGRCP
jgi:hypothetical protein